MRLRRTGTGEWEAPAPDGIGHVSYHLHVSAISAPTDPVAEAAAAMLRRGDNRGAIACLTHAGTLSIRAADYLCDAWFQEREWEKALALLRTMLQHGHANHYRPR